MEKLFIIKIGGDIINEEEKLKSFLAEIAGIKYRKIIIHGGGKRVNQLAEKLGIPQQMVEGRRITDAETLDLAVMVYAGLINKKIVALLQSNQNNALGLSGADNNCIRANKRTKGTHDFGYAGDVVKDGVNSSFISILIENNIVPVFCSITHDNEGQLLNTNADTMASEIAIAMSAMYEVELHYCFEINGVMMNVEDPGSVINKISMKQFELLMEQNIISKGMIPKMQNAFHAFGKGVEKVVISHADQLLNNIIENKDFGTVLTF